MTWSVWSTHFQFKSSAFVRHWSISITRQRRAMESNFHVATHSVNFHKTENNSAKNITARSLGIWFLRSSISRNTTDWCWFMSLPHFSEQREESAGKLGWFISRSSYSNILFVCVEDSRTNAKPRLSLSEIVLSIPIRWLNNILAICIPLELFIFDVSNTFSPYKLRTNDGGEIYNNFHYLFIKISQEFALLARPENVHSFLWKSKLTVISQWISKNSIWYGKFCENGWAKVKQTTHFNGICGQIIHS